MGENQLFRHSRRLSAAGSPHLAHIVALPVLNPPLGSLPRQEPTATSRRSEAFEMRSRRSGIPLIERLPSSYPLMSAFGSPAGPSARLTRITFS